VFKSVTALTTFINFHELFHLTEWVVLLQHLIVTITSFFT